MTLADPPPLADPPTSSPERVAESFELLAREKAWMDQELDEICSAKPALARSTLERLIALGRRLEPAVVVREQLTSMSPEELRAGVALWLSRRA